jgi:D-alanyl-D-alanine carboxypeptidase
MLASANDAAMNIAGHIAGSQEAFVEMMNKRAAEIGCTDTHFVNAHGLDHPDQYTTARDMVKIVQEAIKNETFCEVFGAVGYTIPPTNRTDKKQVIETDNHLIYQLILRKFNRDDVTGGKTSSTSGAGSSLVCTAEDKGMKLICLVMGTERVAMDGKVSYYGNFEEIFELLDFAFDGFRIARVLFPDQALAQFPVERGECDVIGYPDVSVNSVVPENCTLDNLILRFNVEGSGLYAPLSKDQKIATVQVWYQTSCITEAQAFAMNSVRSVVNSGVNINSVASRDDSNVGKFFKTLGLVMMVLVSLFVVYLVINNYRRIRGERRKVRRRAARRRSRRYE